MKTDITNAVKNYPKTTIYDAIKEALVNSIQANATKILINITSTDKDLTDESLLSSVSITDNGEGFNQENKKSFLTYFSRHKQEQGCQGIGRLSYLKSFQKVRISSRQNKELVEFDFTAELSEEKLEPKPINDNSRKTVLTLSDPLEKTSYDLEKAYQEICNHIYPFLFLRTQDCEIVINNNNSQKIDRDSFKNIQALNFKVTKRGNEQEESVDFALFYRFEKSETAILDDFVCINCRPMQRFSKDFKIKLNKIEGYHITFLLESSWINKQANQYHELDIATEDEDFLQESLIIEWADVKKQLEEEVNKLLNNEFPELEEQNTKQINDLKEKYPHLADYIENKGVLGFVDKKKVLDNAYKKARKEEEELEKEDVSIEKIKKCVSNDLIKYILHRQKIITKLQEIKETAVEANIHNLFLKQGLEGTDERQVPLDKNNLWLLDDKFMSYSYIASEKTITTFLKENGLEYHKSTQEMDIIGYFSTTDKKKAVIIELKKLTANYKENGVGISQLFNYSKKLFDAGVKELYLYLFATVKDDFRDELENKEGFKRIFSHEGEVWQNSYKDRNSYIQIISPNAIIADANARNKTFLEIIKNSKKIKS
jgi:hypothetical protein